MLLYFGYQCFFANFNNLSFVTVSQFHPPIGGLENPALFLIMELISVLSTSNPSAIILALLLFSDTYLTSRVFACQLVIYMYVRACFPLPISLVVAITKLCFFNVFFYFIGLRFKCTPSLSFNISVILCLSILKVGETGVCEKTHRVYDKLDSNTVRI